MKLLLLVGCLVAGALAAPSFPQGYGARDAAAAVQQAKASDAVMDWASHGNLAQRWAAEAGKQGLKAAGYDDASATDTAKQQQAASDYGSRASNWDQSANAADRAANQASQSGYSANRRADAADASNARKDQLWTQGNQWYQGRRNNDDVNYTYDKKFDLKDSEDGGFEQAESSNSHELDDMRDRAASYDRNVDQDAAQASAADAAKANQNSAWGQNAATGASSRDNFHRDSANAASANGRDQDWSNKIDQSKGAHRLWSDARQEANDLSKNQATADGSYKREQDHGKNLYDKDVYGKNVYGKSLSDNNLYGKNFYDNNVYGKNLYDNKFNGKNLYDNKFNGKNLYDNKFYGKNLYNNNLYGKNHYDNNPYGKNHYDNNPYGKNLYDNNPYGKNHYDNNPYGKNHYDNNPYGKNHYDNNPYGKNFYDNNPYGKNLYDNNPYGKNFYDQNYGKNLHGNGNPYGFGLAGVESYADKPAYYHDPYGKVSDAARAWDQSSKAGLRQWDSAASSDQTKAAFNRDQWLNDQNRGFDRDAKQAASDKKASDWAQQAAQSGNRAEEAHADSANAWNKDQAQSVFDEDLWKKEVEKKRVSDRSQDKKVYKKWFNNKRRGGDNGERLFYDRDQSDDVFGYNTAAKKDWAQSSDANQWRSAADANGKNDWDGRQAAWDKDSQQAGWKKDAAGWENTKAASRASDDASRRGWNNQQWKDDQASQASDARAQNAQAWDRDASAANSAAAGDAAYAFTAPKVGLSYGGYPAYGYNGAYGYPFKGYGHNNYGYNDLGAYL